MSDHQPSDHDRNATAVSIVVRMRRLGVLWYRMLFLGARNIPWVTDAMRGQRFIHFCHWIVLRDVPTPDGGRRRLTRPVLWFESNYDGDVVRYMDTFARVIPWRMRAAWTPTYRFPDMFPSGPFHQWTVDNAYPADHYWSAYPDATTKDVGRALRVSAAVDRLSAAASAVDLPADDFARLWAAFLDEVQLDL
jgi:hypothetical protein